MEVIYLGISRVSQKSFFAAFGGREGGESGAAPHYLYYLPPRQGADRVPVKGLPPSALPLVPTLKKEYYLGQSIGRFRANNRDYNHGGVANAG